ncbi:CAP domain-containing protein [Deinococcus sp.]|uniref:CAP domain-containing protein n=1 Tax=Deinococcus sp. TaxID=47478 RepID=UPI0025CEE697|nr:CAP domain-containing protein [Deinococcus sp.]
MIRTRTLTLIAAGSLFAFALTSCGGNTLLGLPTNIGSATANTGNNTDAAQSVSPNTAAQGLSADESMILNKTNLARAESHNCGGVNFKATTPLSWNAALAGSARAHTQDMADHNYFSHDGLNGSTLETRDRAAGYTNYKTLGENIIAGYAASEVVAGWLSSPSHCKTLMDPNFKDLGAAFVSKPGTTYGTYATQEFGTR